MGELPVGSAAQLQRRGAQSRQRAQYAEAERCLLRALELEHDFVAAHFELGLTYRDQQRFEDAVDYFQLAVHFAPDFAPGWSELGSVLAKLGREDSAVEACRHATVLDPANCVAWLGLGNLLKARDDWNAPYGGRTIGQRVSDGDRQHHGEEYADLARSKREELQETGESSGDRTEDRADCRGRDVPFKEEIADARRAW